MSLNSKVASDFLQRSQKTKESHERSYHEAMHSHAMPLDQSLMQVSGHTCILRHLRDPAVEIEGIRAVAASQTFLMSATSSRERHTYVS